jgi:SAM-dependent methyltransferase
MAHHIIESKDLSDWLQTPAGQYLLEWEQGLCDQLTADWFGYHALQLGQAQLQGLRHNRMPHRWLALTQHPNSHAGQADFCTDLCALPFADDSLDLVILPHALEASPDPHATLREVARVLVPEGRVLVLGLNPNSLWAWRQVRDRWRRHLWPGRLYLPQSGEFIGPRRLRDWLNLLNFEAEPMQYGCYAPSVQSPQWLKRFKVLDQLGPRWWPFLGAVYAQVAIKRVHGMRLIEPVWRERKRAARALVVSGSGSVSSRSHHSDTTP